MIYYILYIINYILYIIYYILYILFIPKNMYMHAIWHIVIRSMYITYNVTLGPTTHQCRLRVYSTRYPFGVLVRKVAGHQIEGIPLGQVLINYKLCKKRLASLGHNVTGYKCSVWIITLQQLPLGWVDTCGYIITLNITKLRCCQPAFKEGQQQEIIKDTVGHWFKWLKWHELLGNDVARPFAACPVLSCVSWAATHPNLDLPPNLSHSRISS